MENLQDKSIAELCRCTNSKYEEIDTAIIITLEDGCIRYFSSVLTAQEFLIKILEGK